MIEAVITGIVAVAVCMLNNIYQSRVAEKQHNKTIALIDYKLDELTKRVDKHNHVVERTYKLEQLATLHDEKIKVVNHRLTDLEKEGI